MRSASPAASRISKKWLRQRSVDFGFGKKIRRRQRRQADAGHLCAEPRTAQSASHEPLKPVWPVTRTLLPRQKSARGRSRHCHIFHGAAGGPKLFQHRLVTQRVHRVPETAMLEGHHLSHRREPNDRELSQLLSSPSIRSRQRGERMKKPPLISPPSPRGFSMKAVTAVALALERAVAARRPHRRDRRELPMAKVEFDRRADIQIAQPVAIGEAEGWLVLDVARQRA